MSVWIWPLLAVYALGGVVDWRKTVYRVAWKQARRRRHPPDGADVAIAVFDATLHALVWPLPLLVGRDPETFVRRVGSEPKSVRIRRLEREATERSRRIEKLERELEIR